MCKNNEDSVEYFVDLFTYIIQNVYNNVQTQRNPQFCSK